MKKVFIISLLVSGLAMLSFTNYKNKPIEQSNQAAIQVPANVQVALDKSCTMCHNDASKNVLVMLQVKTMIISIIPYNKITLFY